VKTERQVYPLPGRAADRTKQPAGSRLPNLELLLVPGGIALHHKGHILAIAAEGRHLWGATGLHPQGSTSRFRTGIPDLDIAIGVGRGELLAAGMEGHTGRRNEVRAQTGKLLARGRIPDADAVILTDRDQPCAVGMVGQTVDRTRVSRKGP